MSSLEKPSVFLWFYLMLKFSLQLRLKLNVLKKQETFQNAYSLLSDVNFFVRLRHFSPVLAKLLWKSCFPILGAPTWISTHVCCPHLWRAPWFSFPRHFTSLFDFELWLTDCHCDVICDDWTKFASVHGTSPVRPLPCFKLSRFYFSEGVGVRRVLRPIFKKTQLVGGLLASVMS